MMSGALIRIMLTGYRGVDPEILSFRTYVSLQLMCKYTHGLTSKFQRKPEKLFRVLNIYC